VEKRKKKLKMKINAQKYRQTVRGDRPEEEEEEEEEKATVGRICGK